MSTLDLPILILLTIIWMYREQSIFECMIANLFEEYKFFNKYPERQLKIAAVLFGEFIRFYPAQD